MEKQWRCEHCGYVWTGDSPPNYCPNCGHEQDEYEEIKFHDITE